MNNVEIRESFSQPLLLGSQHEVHYIQIENEESREVEQQDEYEVEQQQHNHDEQEENQQDEQDQQQDQDAQPVQVQEDLSTPFRIHRANSSVVLIYAITLQIANLVLFICSKLLSATSDISFYFFVGFKCLILIFYAYMALKGFRKNMAFDIVLFESMSCIFWLMFCNNMAVLFILATGLLQGMCLTIDLLISHYGCSIQSNNQVQEDPLLLYEYIPFVWTSDTNNNQPVCSVCLESIQNGVRLKCLHTYHKICIDTWLAKSDACPMCRTTV